MRDQLLRWVLSTLIACFKDIKLDDTLVRLDYKTTGMDVESQTDSGFWWRLTSTP